MKKSKLFILRVDMTGLGCLFNKIYVIRCHIVQAFELGKLEFFVYIIDSVRLLNEIVRKRRESNKQNRV